MSSISVDGTSILSGGSYFPFAGIKKWTWANGKVYERTFDRDGQVDSITLGPDGGSYGDLSQVFGYDSLNRLTSAALAAGQSQSFSYDANSNRTNATINSASTTYSYPSNSHKLSSLSGATSRSFTYDSAGNVTASAGITYVYDGRGRMKQAGGTTYLVNGLGQRVKKSGGTDTYFAYDEAGHLIGEYDATGAPIQETVWLGDTPVAVVKPATPSGFTVYNVWTDLLDTPRLITDTSNNSRWEWANNDPFGNNAPNENPASLGVFTYNLRFPGQYYDSETGKHYNYFRDYDASTGRYLQSDLVGLKGGINTFTYTSDPLSFSDSLGLEPGNAYQRGYGYRMPDFDGEPGLEPVCVECIIPALRFRLPARPRGTQPGLPPPGAKPPVSGQCTVGPATRGDGKSLWDTKGGEWRYKPEDKWHNPHWDYNPWTSWNSSWQNVPINNRPPVK